MNLEPLDVFHCPLDGTQLIEASAGTGKTWNLCGLVLRLLLERGLPVEQVLVVTFTNAATAELHERIRGRIAQTSKALRGDTRCADDPFVAGLLRRLRDELGLADALLGQRLDAALQTFDEAAILTIHGFCQRALADAPFSAGLPLATELLTDDGALRLQVVQDFWRRRIAGPALPAPVAALLLARGDSPSAMPSCCGAASPRPLAVLRWPEALDAGPLPGFDLDGLRAAHDAARALWAREREAIVELLRRSRAANLNGVTYKEATLQKSFEQWDRLLRSADPVAADATLDRLDLLGEARLRACTKAGKVTPEHPFFALAQDLLDRREATGHAAGLHRLALLRELLTTGPEALRQLKRERRVVAFDDMLANLHERLTGPHGAALAATLRARFPAVLIDEFQDTDPLQWAIFEAVWGPSRQPLFLIGDPKQAIYSFRNADLHTYLQARSTAGARHGLAHNQRSVPGLIDGLNGLFGGHPRAFFIEGLDFHPVQPGDKPRPRLDAAGVAPPAPLQLWTLPDGDDGQPLDKAQALHLAAQACAGEIARLLGQARAGRLLLEGRPLGAGDIAVLVRSHAQAARMRQALAAVGVGSVEVSQASVFSSVDAEELERLLTALLQPGRERLLRAALATELLGHDAPSLHRLMEDEDGLLAWVERFAEDRERWRQQGIGVVLRGLMRREDVAGRLLARPDGERRMTNLLHLAELLQQAEAEPLTPQALLAWLQRQRRERRASEATELRLESDRHLVQIVTIHRSKGLEYPLVFCPFLFDGDTGARRAASGEAVEWHDDDGRLVLDLRGDLPKPDADARAGRIAAEAMAEHLRLLYVALTRAVHRCHVVVGRYGRRSGRGTSVGEGDRSPLHWLVAGGGRTPADWLAHGVDPATLASAWQAFAVRHAPAVDLSPLPSAAGTVLPAERPDPLAVQALPPPARLPGAWWLGSYSSLAHGARHEGAATDHDARVDDPAPPPAPAMALADTDILRFPRGPAAGDCLHAVFERIDFTDPDGWPPAIDSVLRRHAGVAAQAPGAPLAAMLRGAVEAVVQTPLMEGRDGGLRLAEVTPRRRLVELEFTLPSRRLRAGALSALLQRHGVAAPALSFGELQGYLRGFIDLVVEHQGRFFVVDWKSNHLGDAPADYAAASLQRAMAQHGYALQALIYCLALHRHLQRRLPGYRYEQHHGGALYLFVRGVRPAWGRAGVHAWKPPRALVEAFSALLDGVDTRSAA
ncbi:exodeoxyribonuclease V subunit beta [Aquabacterium sp. J223]|uniref:exodeoxyribonuclease V subunit beta n=1 Tax=Aquabacterium sp. J223 TaxID=2898431 RepID=UPI0021AD8E11|nr:exodeoxyribonuclease V subunit beta [Aquabacterium sp. J223]UUX94246.1 exodeoxyribonuclease V subunit beta [Aquabacterium sp. J223]